VAFARLFPASTSRFPTRKRSFRCSMRWRQAPPAIGHRQQRWWRRERQAGPATTPTRRAFASAFKSVLGAPRRRARCADWRRWRRTRESGSRWPRLVRGACRFSTAMPPKAQALATRLSDRLETRRALRQCRRSAQRRRRGHQRHADRHAAQSRQSGGRRSFLRKDMYVADAVYTRRSGPPAAARPRAPAGGAA